MTLVPVAEAQARLFALADPVSTETLPIRQAAGRWAAADIAARRTQPVADLSAMDGYAIRFADLPGPWRVTGESAAGRPFAGTVAAGEAVRIFTGAALPDGADTVLVQEEAARQGERLMLGGEGPAHRGRNVRARGLDFHDGDRLIAAGERLTPARIAVAATGGQGRLPVRRAVRVALAATGDELVPAGGPISGAQLPESNGAMLAAMLADLPVEIVDLGILPDRLDVLTEAFRSVEADLLVTTGGASVGDHDLVRPALLAAGGEIDFWRIALRPGKPMMAGRLSQALVLGLPGNPVSAFVTATLFVRPLIAHLAGAADPLPVTTHALLGEDLPANGGRTDYLRARLEDGRAYASTIQDSSMLLTLARSTCLILRPAHAPAARAGESAEILVIA
ncbi:molybdopterin molybdotransferase [Sphingomonas sp. SORGH_AS802]|uniref:molybdopterin molybdotransferase MoeA n=1 Tax=unclassified Sphingomonas TaxID=196159 RepID=UPI00285B706D|nr:MULTISPECIES: molybdopterin molybdotransferase MoeA [unclassified Sphingomonas]MDR6127017.1 molybdopterin molybdotransferase [Sphingomonas sp. SORGH_AS_0438]MDR6134621.1 molybdopterin molybdotransferase [Sphingomonas sp. SORGH_AS_0802]